VTTHPDYKSFTSTISVRQPLFNLDALARYRQGKAQTAYSGAQFASRSQDVMVRLMVAYGDAKFAEEQLRLYTAQRDTFAEQMLVNNRMFEKGEGTKTDMLETQAKLDVSDARVIEATDNLVTARDTLGAMLGQKVTQLDGLANDFSVMPLSPAGFDEWKSNASSQNAEIAAARFELEAAEQEVNKSRAGHMPRLDLNASYSRSKSDSLINLDREATVRSIGVQLVVPLYSGGYVDALTSQALARRDKAQADLDATTSKVMIELHRQYSATQNSLAKITALQKSVNSATLLVTATQQSVKGGQRINLDVLNAQQQRVSAELDLTKARYGYLIGLLKLRMAAGTLNPDDLRAVAAQFSAAD
jgi:protease secretion system outer membrane protein